MELNGLIVVQEYIEISSCSFRGGRVTKIKGTLFLLHSTMRLLI